MRELFFFHAVQFREIIWITLSVFGDLLQIKAFMVLAIIAAALSGAHVLTRIAESHVCKRFLSVEQPYISKWA